VSFRNQRRANRAFTVVNDELCKAVCHVPSIKHSSTLLVYHVPSIKHSSTLQNPANTLCCRYCWDTLFTRQAVSQCCCLWLLLWHNGWPLWNLHGQFAMLVQSMLVEYLSVHYCNATTNWYEKYWTGSSGQYWYSKLLVTIIFYKIAIIFSIFSTFTISRAFSLLSPLFSPFWI
jgi:hypothetical protein